jgi:voltage-gated potassium channel
MKSSIENDHVHSDRERYRLLRNLDRLLEVPFAILSVVWLALLTLDVAGHLSKTAEIAAFIIWIAFFVELGLKIIIAPKRWRYLRRNWLTVLALIAPAFRLIRFARAFQLLRVSGVAPALRLTATLATLNKNIRLIAATMKRRGVGFVLAITTLVLFAGSAAIYTVESEEPGGMRSLKTAIYWTATTLTSGEPEYRPISAAGKVLSLFMDFYGMTVFGFFTATLASHFIGRDTKSFNRADRKLLTQIANELHQLRSERSVK